MIQKHLLKWTLMFTNFYIFINYLINFISYNSSIFRQSSKLGILRIEQKFIKMEGKLYFSIYILIQNFYKT